MSNVQVTILGDEDLRRIFKQIPLKMTEKILVAAGRRAAKPFLSAAKVRARMTSKRLARSIGVKRSKKYRGAVFAGVRRGKKQAHNLSFIAHWIEEGTKGIKRKRSASNESRPNNPAFSWMYHIKKGGRFRDDQPAQPFLAPAWSATDEMVEKEYKKQITFEIHRIIAKNNNFKLKQI